MFLKQWLISEHGIQAFKTTSKAKFRHVQNILDIWFWVRTTNFSSLVVCRTTNCEPLISNTEVIFSALPSGSPDKNNPNQQTSHLSPALFKFSDSVSCAIWCKPATSESLCIAILRLTQAIYNMPLNNLKFNCSYPGFNSPTKIHHYQHERKCFWLSSDTT